MVKAEPRAPGVPGGYEVDVHAVEMTGIADPYPISPKEHGVEFLMENRHLWLRSNRSGRPCACVRVIVQAIREWLDDNGYLNVDTPILTPAAAEGTTTLFEIDYHGEPAYLAQTGQLYNEANIFAFGKVYCFGPTFRAEKSKTRRHLQEFWMVEPEIAFCDLEELMEIEEQFVSHIVQRCLRDCAAELEVLERDLTHLRTCDAALPAPALRRCRGDDQRGRGRAASWCPATRTPCRPSSGARISAAPTRPTSPPSSKNRSSCITIPRGQGLLHGAGTGPCRSLSQRRPAGARRLRRDHRRQRAHERCRKRLIAGIEKHKLPKEVYDWYIDLRRYGSVVHSGFGLGVERTVAWICGLDHVRETIAFPRTLTSMSP